MSDDVMVRPVRTFMEGAFLMTPESEPYPVSRSRALELQNNGLVELDGVAPADPVPPTGSAPDGEAPKTSGRRPRAS